jgi:hypothetical protein
MKTVANDETGRLRDAAYWKRSSRFVGPVDLLVLAVWAAQVVVVFLYTAARTRFGQNPQDLFSSSYDYAFLLVVILVALVADSSILRHRYERRFAILLSYALVFFSTWMCIIPPLMFFGGGL